MTSLELFQKNARAHVQHLLEYQNEHTDKYNSIHKYVSENLGNLIVQSQVNGVSVADIVQVNTNCPYFIAEDIVRSEVVKYNITQ